MSDDTYIDWYMEKRKLQQEIEKQRKEICDKTDEIQKLQNEITDMCHDVFELQAEVKELKSDAQMQARTVKDNRIICLQPKTWEDMLTILYANAPEDQKQSFAEKLRQEQKARKERRQNERRICKSG